MSRRPAPVGTGQKGDRFIFSARTAPATAPAWFTSGATTPSAGWSRRSTWPAPATSCASVSTSTTRPASWCAMSMRWGTRAGTATTPTATGN